MRKKPTALKQIDGTLRKNRQNLHEPMPPRAEDLNPPLPLDEHGQKFWNYHAPRLHKPNLLTELDTFSLLQACQWWSIHQRAMAELESGLVHSTEANGSCSRPEVGIAKNSFACVRAIMLGFGLDPQSRSKINIPPPEQRDEIEDLYFKRRPVRPVAV